MAHTLRLGRWAALAARGAFSPRRLAYAGIFGGRTSGMMAALLDPTVRLHFENTGREHPRTLDFLHELDQALGGRIVWLEFRKPWERGAPPRRFEFAVVSYKTAARKGEPFAEFMEALAEYRATKGEPPISPWARQRLCTAYMKHKVLLHYVRSLGLDDLDLCVGLRADEKDRVRALKRADQRNVVFRTPLDDAGIDKAQVMEFWAAQPFDLGIRENQGNCTGCFLKDQGDLARVLMEPETDRAFWFYLEDTYPDFGGRRFPGYRQLATEGPVRLGIEAALRAGREPANAGTQTAARFRLLVLQERKRLKEPAPGFSCACEASFDQSEDPDGDPLDF